MSKKDPLTLSRRTRTKKIPLEYNHALLLEALEIKNDDDDSENYSSDSDLDLEINKNPTGDHATIKETSSALLLPHEWIYKIKYLVFSGGGCKGYSYLGCILILDEYFRQKGKNLYQQIKGFSGTSVGAMYALLMTLNVRSNKLIHEVVKTDISHVMKNISIDNLMEMYGLNTCSGFRYQIYDILEKYTGQGNITFKDLYTLTKKHYVCCVTNVSTGKPEYHSYLTTPDFKVVESVSASMSIPLIFTPSIINGQYYVDGGIMDNSPFCVFPAEEIFILYLEGNLPDLSSSLQNYVLRLAMLGLRTMDHLRLQSQSAEYRRRRLIINIHDVTSIDFNVTMETKKNLVIKGAECMEKFINPSLLMMEYAKLMIKILFQHIFKAP